MPYLFFKKRFKEKLSHTQLRCELETQKRDKSPLFFCLLLLLFFNKKRNKQEEERASGLGTGFWLRGVQPRTTTR